MHAMLEPIHHMTFHCYGAASDLSIGDPDMAHLP